MDCSRQKESNEAESDVWCDVCKVQSILNPSLKWCPECQETFCEECVKFHSNSRYTKDHTVIDIDDFKKLPPFVLEVSRFCSEHDAPYQNFCMDHDQPCCSKCIDTKHKGCKGLPALSDVIKGAKSSAALSDVEERLDFLKDYFNDLYKENKKNIKDITNESESILAEIKEIRKSLNEHLDLLEDKIVDQLSVAKINSQKELDAMADIILKRENNIRETMEGIKNMKQYASDLQIFLGTKTSDQQIREEEKTIADMKEQGKLNMHRINLKQDSQIGSILSDFKSFGEIAVVSEHPQAVIVKPNNLQSAVAEKKRSYWSFGIFYKK